jgi:hypothetical protein
VYNAVNVEGILILSGYRSKRGKEEYKNIVLYYSIKDQFLIGRWETLLKEMRNFPSLVYSNYITAIHSEENIQYLRLYRLDSKMLHINSNSFDLPLTQSLLGLTPKSQ